MVYLSTKVIKSSGTFYQVYKSMLLAYSGSFKFLAT